MNRRTLLVFAAALAVAGLARPVCAQGERRPFSPQELDQILAPIALYDDALLAQVLMAASYPLEVVEAARWSKANPALKGDAAVTAVKDQTWDVSVKSLVAFPAALMQLNDHLDWTQKLGDAMVSQQQDVADSIQRLRAKAAAAGNLKSGPQQTVTSQGSGADQTIIIEPAQPNTVYVPAYDPNWAYGAWPDPAYPPVYYPPPPAYGYGRLLANGLMWGLGIAATAAIFSNWNWSRGAGYVNVNANRAVNIDNSFDRNRYANNSRWQHDGNHRRGVAYRDGATRQQYGQQRPGAEQRQQFRGQVANQRPDAGAGQRPNVGQGQRPNAGQGQRPNAGQGQRPNAGQGGQRVQQRPQGQNPGGNRPSAISGVNRGQQVNREAARGRAQQSRAGSHPRGGGGARAGGGGGARGGGGGARGGGGRR